MLRCHSATWCLVLCLTVTPLALGCVKRCSAVLQPACTSLWTRESVFFDSLLWTADRDCDYVSIVVPCLNFFGVCGGQLQCRKHLVPVPPSPRVVRACVCV
eukprot:scpid84541/ scgid32749/ 